MTEGQPSAEGSSKEPSPECFIAVHIGAGRHSRRTEHQYKAGSLGVFSSNFICQYIVCRLSLPLSIFSCMALRHTH